MIEVEPLKVKLEIFEGPLDLLLYLVKKNSYDIFDIPITDITRQYLDYLEFMRTLNLNIAGDFLVMAATLLRIKAQMLLPRPSSEERETIEDPRIDLAKQLYQLYIYKEAARKIDERIVLWRDTFIPLAQAKIEEDIFEAELFDLIKVFADLIRRKKPTFDYRSTPFRFSVVERMETILKLLEQKGGKLDFNELFENFTLSRELIITTFLAVLELTRVGRIRIFQPLSCDTIYIFSRAESVWLTS